MGDTLLREAASWCALLRACWLGRTVACRPC